MARRSVGGRRVDEEADIAAVCCVTASKSAGLAVLHLDKDVELIAEVTGQSIERLAVAADT